MASSSSNLTSTFHTRSISLPSRPNPLVLDVNEHIQRLISSSEATTSPSSSSLSCKLGELRNVYESVNRLLQLPHTQQLLACENHRKDADGMLNSSLCFLDACGIAKEVLMQTKDQAQQLQSVLRRKRDDEPEALKEVSKFLASRKNSKKMISNSLKAVKSKCADSLPSLEPGNDTTLDVIRRVEAVSATLLGSLLRFLSGTKAQPKASSWSLSKLMPSKRVSCEDEAAEVNMFEKVEALLQGFVSGKTRKNINDEMKSELKRLESSIQDLEEELESVHRGIIRARALLLNILTR